MGNAFVRRTSDFNVVGGSGAVYIPWNGIDYADQGTIDGNYPTRLICTSTGSYNIEVNVKFKANTNLSSCEMKIKKNRGSVPLASLTLYDLVVGNNYSFYIEIAKSLTLNDYIEVAFTLPTGSGIALGSILPPPNPVTSTFKLTGPIQ